MKPVVDRLAATYKDKVDLYIYAEADKDTKAAAFATSQRISSVPTIVVVGSDGREIERFVGTTPERTVAAALDKAQSTAAAVDAAEQPQ
jgi:thioredoxin-like negative regulator of GroEL